ncbi:MAG: helix-hairpin-helix domain-containing protein, partial [Candidatus Thermoplasmatota archaeon]|nr:helix-hairpin-helix domain-containing protein [Candidatus Thermoplasmatota archaeon]
MSSGKNSKKNGIEKLRILLDEKSMKKLNPEDEKYLLTLKKRLERSSNSKTVIKKIVETSQTEEYSLKPNIIIHTKKQVVKPSPKIIFEEKSIQREPELIFKEVSEGKKIDDDLIEIKKVEIRHPEFIEVKPKTTKKHKSLKKEVITEWEALEEKEEQVIKKESTESKKQNTVEEESIPYFIPVEKSEELKDDIELKKEVSKKSFIEPENNEIISVEPTIKEETIESKKSKIEKFVELGLGKNKVAFKDIESIDEETAEILYDHGFISIDALSLLSVEDFVKITGIKKRKAKQIKEEIDKKKDKIFGYKYIETREITQGEIIEEKFREIDEYKISDEEKIKIFNEIKSIDKETAILLYNNGYTSIDSLKYVTTKDLKKIKYIDKKKVKNIIFEIQNRFKEIDPNKPLVEEYDVEYFEEEFDIDLKEADENIQKNIQREKQDFFEIEGELISKEKIVKQQEEKIKEIVKILDEKKEEIEEKNNELEDLKISIDEKNKTIGSLKEDFDTSISDLEKNKNILLEKEQTIETLRCGLSNKKQELEKKTNDYENLKEKAFTIDENIINIRKELDEKTQ